MILSVSEVLNAINAVLYESEDNSACVRDNSVDISVFEAGAEVAEARGEMADSAREPSNQDILKAIQDNTSGITARLDILERRLGILETLEKKVTEFEKDLKKVWVALEDRARRTEDKVSRLEDKVDASEISYTEISSRVSELDRQRQQLSDDVSYLEAQSMRNNLVFFGIQEDNTSGSEPPAVTERKLRDHLHQNMKIAKETVEALRLERVHRMPSQPVAGKVRNIVARFTFFKDRETVRQQWPQLKGTNYFVNEQFPPEVQTKRARLFPKMKAARREGKRAWVSYDTLYVDGRAVRD